MQKLVTGMILFCCAMSQLFAQSRFYYHKPHWPLLSNVSALDTSGKVYAAAGVSMYIDSVYGISSGRLRNVNEKSFSRNGSLLSITEKNPSQHIMYSVKYTTNANGTIMRVERESRIQDSTSSHEISEVLAVDSKNRALRTLETYPLQGLSRNVLQPQSLNNAVTEQLSSKAAAKYPDRYFSKIYRAFTYIGDTQKIVLCKRLLGTDTVQTDEYTYNSNSDEVKLKRWIYPNSTTKALSIFVNGLLTETKTYISGKLTEHTIFVYTTVENNYYRNYTCKVYSALVSPRKFLFTLQSGSEAYTLVFPNNQTKIISKINEYDPNSDNNDKTSEHPGDPEPRKVEEENGYRIEYYYYGTRRRTEWYSANGLFQRSEGEDQKILRTYSYY